MWEVSRSVLAKLVEEEEWSAILSGVDSAIAFGDFGEEFEGPLIDENQRTILSSLMRDIESAIDALRSYRAAGALVQDSTGLEIRRGV